MWSESVLPWLPMRLSFFPSIYRLCVSFSVKCLIIILQLGCLGICILLISVSFLIILDFVCYMLTSSSPNLWSFLFLFWFLEFFILLCFSRVPTFTMVEIMSHFLLKSAFLCLVQEFFTYLRSERWCPVFSLIICKVCLSYLSLVYMVLILFICTTRSIFIFFCTWITNCPSNIYWMVSSSCSDLQCHILYEK